MSFLNRGGLVVTLVETLDKLKEFINKNDINKREFLENLDYAIKKARVLVKFTNEKVTYDDVIALVAYFVANGDKELTELVNAFLDSIVRMIRDLGGDNDIYFKEIVFYYLQK